MDLTKGDISKLTKTIAIPASIGFFFNTMYNVVDTYFAGLVSSTGLAALTLSFPVFFIIIALGNGFSTGTTALIANELGRNNREGARIYATQAIIYGIFLAFFLSLLGILMAPFIFEQMGATGEYLSITLEYINVILIGAVFLLLTFILNASLNAVGNTKTYRNFLVAGFLLNIVLDPLFIFWLDLGIMGIALATVLINVIGMFYIGYMSNREGILCLKCLKYVFPKPKIFKDITQQGFPASLNMMTVALGFFVITYFLSGFGESAVAAYGVALRIEQIFLLPTIGLNIATLSIIGQSFGAKKFSRVLTTLKTNIKYGLIVTFFGGLIIFFAGPLIMRIFTVDSDIIQMGAFYLKFAALMQWGYVLIFMNISALQGLKKPLFAFWIGIYRQIVAPLVLFYLFTVILDLKTTGIWLGIFVAVWTGALITVVYARKRMDAILAQSTTVPSGSKRQKSLF